MRSTALASCALVSAVSSLPSRAKIWVPGKDPRCCYDFAVSVRIRGWREERERRKRERRMDGRRNSGSLACVCVCCVCCVCVRCALCVCAMCVCALCVCVCACACSVCTCCVCCVCPHCAVTPSALIEGRPSLISCASGPSSTSGDARFPPLISTTCSCSNLPPTKEVLVHE